MAKWTTGGRRRHPSRVRAPTRAPVGPKRWPERRWAALTIRVVVFVVPILASFGVAWVLSNAMAVPEGLAARVVRWLFVAAIATVVMVVAQRLLRRLLPLAALLSLTLVFPDETPSRFGLALRGMSARRLDLWLAEIDRDGLGETPREAAETLLELVAALSRHDRLTRGHSERVRAYAVMLGEEMELPAEVIDQLRWAALVHDVGKLAVPSEVLTKPGQLTDAEFELIRQHPGAGKRLVAPLAGWLGPAASAVYEHHERWEGGGYPTGVPSERLALTSRIVSVADAFDVMTSARSYKEATSASAARAELQRCAGTQFDPQVVRAMMNISLGRLWRTMGPFSWLAQASLFPRSVAQAGPAVSTVAAALVSLVMSGLADVTTATRQQVLSSVADAPSAEGLPPILTIPAGGGRSGRPSGPVSPGGDVDPSSPPSVGSPSSTTSPSTTLVAPIETISGTVAQLPPIAPPPATGREPVTGTTTPATSTIVVTLPTTSGTPSTTRPTVAPSTTPTTFTVTTTPTTSAVTTTTTTTTQTTTTTVGSVTTTTVTTANRTFVLSSDGVGDRTSQTVLDLDTTRAPANGALPNYDTDRNGDPGLTIIASPTDVATSDPTGVQVWRLPGSVTEVSGPVALTLWLAREGAQQPGFVQVRAGLFDCDAARADCVRLARDAARYIPPSSDFTPVAFDLSVPGGHQVATGRAIELRVAVMSGSSNAVWVGYDAVVTPSFLLIGR